MNFDEKSFHFVLTKKVFVIIKILIIYFILVLKLLTSTSNLSFN